MLSVELGLLHSLLHQRLWDESLCLGDPVPTLQVGFGRPTLYYFSCRFGLVLPFIISTPVAGKARLPWQLYLFRFCFPLKRGLQ